MWLIINQIANSKTLKPPALVPQNFWTLRSVHVSGVGIKWARSCSPAAPWIFQGGSDVVCWKR